MKSFYGIDFGTTNTALVRLRDGNVTTFGDESGRPMPSIATIDRVFGTVKVGRTIWEKRDQLIARSDSHVVGSVKWDIGTGRNWDSQSGNIAAEAVVTEIFRSLCSRVEQSGADPVTSAIVTIPVNYPAEKRRALRSAAREAGIEVEAFLSESTAALMRHIEDLKHFQNIAVFDWGGGTLDVSLLSIAGRRVEEISTEGWKFGGDDLDLVLAKAVHARIMSERGTPISFEDVSIVDRDLLRTQCEIVKCSFSNQPTALVALRYCDGVVTLKLQRDWFEALIQDKVDEAITVLSRCINHSGMRPEALQRILLVGGTSRLRLLHERLQQNSQFVHAYFPTSDAGWDVAWGAALVSECGGNYVTANSLGIVLSDGSMLELVGQGESISPIRSLSVSLVEDTRSANFIVAATNRQQYERLLQFHVPVMGFSLEQIDFHYCLTPDLTLRLEVESRMAGRRSRTVQEAGKVKFVYQL
jgi:molecular chaperone DnaK